MRGPASNIVGEDRGQAAAKTKVFISYSRKNIAFADRLEAALKVRGFEPLIDRTEIHAFEDWWKRIQALIAQAHTVIFVLSPDAVASDVCAKEIVHAASLNKRFAPIVFQRVDDRLVPEALARLNFIFFDDDARFDESVERLCDALASDIEWIRKHTEYGLAARHWIAAGRPGGLLLRSPSLEEAEHWIASRPASAPAPTEETQAFVTESRRGTTKRRNVLTGGLAAGLVLALALAGLAFWQRSIALAAQARAEHTLKLATSTATGLVNDLAQKFRNTVGVPAAIVKDMLDRARNLQDQLLGSGESAPELRKSQAEALMEVSRTLLVLGETEAAVNAGTQARDLLLALAELQPKNDDIQIKLSWTYTRIGDALVAQHKLAEALQAYEASLDIDNRLVKADPTNADRLQSLAVDYQRIGNVRRERSNWTEALTSFRTSLEIFAQLAKTDPENNRKQRDLSVAYEKVGDILVAQNDLPGAFNSYREALVIDERLTKIDPNNAQWRRDQEVMLGKIGDVQLKQNNLAEALKSFQAELAIAEQLAKSDSGNKNWQRDLAVTYNSIGDVLSAQRNQAEALTSYRAALAIVEALTKSDPSNGIWQNDLSASYQRIGDALQAQGSFADALAAYRVHEEIEERLAKADPNNATRQGQLASAHCRIAIAQFSGGDLPAALAGAQICLAIQEQLANADPNDPFKQSQLAITYSWLVSIYKAMKNLAELRKAIDTGRAIALRLVTAHPDVKQYKDELAWFDRELAALKT
jgi:tetratricopeptide (TPR) repeat protein